MQAPFPEYATGVNKRMHLWKKAACFSTVFKLSNIMNNKSVGIIPFYWGPSPCAVKREMHLK